MKVTVLEKGNIYERNRWPYILTMPISWLMTLWVILKKKLFVSTPSFTNSIFFDHFAKKLWEIKKGARSWKALDIIYNHQFGKNKTLVGLLEDFWIGMMNAQSVRNRFKLIKIELKKTLMNFKDEPEIRLMSLACGSAEVVIYLVSELKKEGIFVRVLLVDIDPEALVYARRLAEKYDVVDQIETLESNVLKVKKIASAFKPHVTEMLGLLDYLEPKTAIPLIRRIKEQLPVGGFFLTCNIHPNLERHFLKHVIDWPMIYREPIELASIITEAGFSESEAEIIYEPLEIHGIVIARK